MAFNDLVRYALLPLLVVSFLSSTANASGYCIDDIAVPQPYLSDDIKNIPLLRSGRDGRPILPSYWKKLDGSNRVIGHNAISVFTDESETYYTHIASVLWQFSPDDKTFKQPQLIEPYVDLFKPHYSPLEDRILFVDERWVEKDGSKTYQPKLYEYDFKSPARLVDSSLATFPSNVHRILWSEGLNGWLLTHEHKPHYRTVALWTKSDLKPLNVHNGASISRHLPEIEKVAVLSSRGFHLLNLDGSTALFQHVNSGDDYNGWDALYPLQNNWFYIAGAQYDHLFQMIKEGDEWRAGELIRLRPKEGFFLSLLTKLTGFDKTQVKRDNLSSIKYMNLGKRSYSPVLKTIIFGEAGKIFKNGKLEKNHPFHKLHWPLGDIEFAGITAYWGKDKKIHLYDGKKWMVASGPKVQRGSFSIVSSHERIFYRTFTDGKYPTTPIYELLQKDGGWVIELANTPEESPAPFTKFYDPLHSDDILVFTRRSIYTLNGNKWQAIWEPENIGVHITGHMTPLRLGAETEKKGILFTAGETFHWLERCE